jgi:hypothetical protein
MKVYSSRQIGKKMGLSHQGVIDVINRSNLNIQLPLSDEEMERLIEYYRDEKSKK